MLALPLTAAQETVPVPTLAVPTLVPRPPAAPPDGLPSTSAVAEIQATGRFKVGVLYNAPPYSEFTLQGDLRGFDIDLLNLIAAAWGSELDFTQVTRMNALEKLRRGEVHALASVFVHYRDLDEALEFSQTYRQGKQSLLLRADSAYSAAAELRGPPVGYVIGTRAEKALDLWAAQAGPDLNLRYYLTLDRAAAALARGEIEAVAAEEQALRRVQSDYGESLRLLDEPILYEPHAFALRRQDAPLRNLLNRTLQLLTQTGKLPALFHEYFPDESFPEEALVLWQGIGEEVNPGQFAAEIAYPSAYTWPRLRASGRLRVGGIAESAAGLAGVAGRLADLNRTMATALASRWGLELEIVPSSAADAAELLSSGAVDLVVGAQPSWAASGLLDFSAPYLLHGDRLMVETNVDINNFYDLRGRIIGLILGDETAQARAQAWANTINAAPRYYWTDEDGAARTLLEYDNAHAIYADSLSLIPHLTQHPTALRLTERWYSRSYYAFALPLNDLDFRLLVDYTVQELIKDGTLYQLTAPLLFDDRLPAFDITPGASVVAGINLARS